MSETIRFLIGCMVPITALVAAAFLIYKQVPGWGWYLFVAACVALGTSVKVD